MNSNQAVVVNYNRYECQLFLDHAELLLRRTLAGKCGLVYDPLVDCVSFKRLTLCLLSGWNGNVKL